MDVLMNLTVVIAAQFVGNQVIMLHSLNRFNLSLLSIF